MKLRTILLLAGVASQIVMIGNSQADDSASLLPVDCLLPGQVRKMGRVTTFITQRRPIKTAAIDCEIRGGEYVAYDRASYTTALKIWLSSAQAGDAKAQLYVAHIYEKGLGTAPDYTEAASWYQKASDGGNAEAMLGLAQLFEKGLGVDQNLNMAKALYARAIGDPALIELQPVTLNEGSITLKESDYAELVSLLGGHPGQPYTLVDLARIHSEERARLQQSLETATYSMEEQRRVLHEEQARADELNGRLGSTLEQLAKVEAQRDHQNQSLVSLQEALEGPKQALAEQDSRVKNLLADMAERQAEADTLRATLAEKSGDQRQNKKMLKQISSLERALAKQDNKLQKENDRQARLAQSLDKKNQEIRTLENASRQYETQIRSLEKALQEPRKQIEDQSSLIAVLEKQVEAANSQAQQYKTQLDKSGEAAEKLSLDNLAGPTLALIEPTLKSTRGVSVVSVMSTITSRQITGRVDAPTGLMSLTVNGEKQEVNERGIFSTSVVILAEKTPVEVIAIDTQGKRSALTFEMSTDAEQIVKRKKEVTDYGKYYALIIGNSDYRFLPDLVTPSADVKDVVTLLENRYGFETTLVLDGSRNEIINALNEYRKTLTSKDNFLIYYAGHGGLDEVNNRGHWLPVDAESDNPVNWLNNTVITDFLNIINAKQILVVSDSCYSGALTRSAMMKMQGGMTEQEYEKYLAVLSQKKARTALTSGGLAPVLDVGGGRHSVFSQAFLESLENNEGVIEGQRLYREVLARVSLRAASIDFKQEPEYAPINFSGHEGGDFLFVPSANR